MRTRRVLAPTRRQAMSLSTISQVGVRGKGIMVSMEPTMTISPEKGRYDFGVVSLATRKSMQGNKRRDTKPEIKVRQMLRAMGFTGYRCDWKKAPGRPDVAFVGRKKAIFVMGCFWHRCPACNLSVGAQSLPAFFVESGWSPPGSADSPLPAQPHSPVFQIPNVVIPQNSPFQELWRTFK